MSLATHAKLMVSSSPAAWPSLAGLAEVARAAAAAVAASRRADLSITSSASLTRVIPPER